jgi:hypothetical protein
MFDMQLTNFPNSENFTFFEPCPYDKFDDNTLEGCLRQFSKVENLFDKNNLYNCESCTEDQYGKSKFKIFSYFIYHRVKEASENPVIKKVHDS